MHARHTQTAVVTASRSPGRIERPRRRHRPRMLIVTEQALRKLGLERSSTRVVIQGIRKTVGGMAAETHGPRGLQIVCIVEFDGGGL